MASALGLAISCVDIRKSREVTNLEELSETSGTEKAGVNRSYKLVLDGNKTFFWKPKFGEHISRWRHVPPKQEYIREFIAYIISKQLGWNIVPEVKIVTYKGQIGSLQSWIDATGVGDKTLAKYSNSDIWKIGLLDLILASVDRHYGNWIDEGIKPWAIDNGYSCPNKEGDRYSLIISRFANRILNKPIPQQLIEDMKRLQYSSFQDKVKKYLDRPSVELLNQRISKMISTRIANAGSGYKVVDRRPDVF